MPTNFKRLVHARMAKTGEMYQTAARHIRANGGGARGAFEALVLEVIALSRAERAEYLRNNPEGSDRSPRELSARIVREIHDCPPRAERALRQKLDSLSWEELRKLEIVMYGGREGQSPLEMHRVLSLDGREGMQMTLTSKAPLAKYLEDGLELSRNLGLDLDAPLPRL